jgi:hypothetical protein
MMALYFGESYINNVNTIGYDMIDAIKNIMA